MSIEKAYSPAANERGREQRMHVQCKPTASFNERYREPEHRVFRNIW